LNTNVINEFHYFLNKKLIKQIDFLKICMTNYLEQKFMGKIKINKI
jgi:hypothetical protein